MTMKKMPETSPQVFLSTTAVPAYDHPSTCLQVDFNLATNNISLLVQPILMYQVWFQLLFTAELVVLACVLPIVLLLSHDVALLFGHQLLVRLFLL